MNILLKDLALYLKKEKALIISDIHLGFEESLNKQGILVPRFQYEETIQRLKKILNILKINKIIEIGDFKNKYSNMINILRYFHNGLGKIWSHL